MQKKYVHAMKVLALALLLPCLYGCQGGGGAGGGGSSSGASLSSFAFDGGTDTTLGTIHNPEPATMLLFGSGIVAMRFARNRKNRLPRDQKR